MAKRILSKERLRQLLAAAGEESDLSFLAGYDKLTPLIEDMVRVERTQLLNPRLVEKIEQAVRAEHALNEAPKSADKAFHKPPYNQYASTREMARGTRACLVRPMSLAGKGSFPFAKWLDSGRNDQFGTSVLLLWTHSVYDDFQPTLVDPEGLPNFKQVRDEAILESGLAAKQLASGASTRSLPGQFRALYTQNRWGRWVWRTGDTLQQGSSPPADGPIIEDRALHQLLSFFGDCEVLHELFARQKGPTSSIWRWFLVAPARIAVIIRKVRA